MKKDYEIVKLPKWITDAKRNAKARERYFIKRYGNLDRMNEIERKKQEWHDNDSWENELAAREGK